MQWLIANSASGFTPSFLFNPLSSIYAPFDSTFPLISICYRIQQLLSNLSHHKHPGSQQNTLIIKPWLWCQHLLLLIYPQSQLHHPPLSQQLPQMWCLPLWCLPLWLLNLPNPCQCLWPFRPPKSYRSLPRRLQSCQTGWGIGTWNLRSENMASHGCHSFIGGLCWRKVMVSFPPYVCLIFLVSTLLTVLSFSPNILVNVLMPSTTLQSPNNQSTLNPPAHHHRSFLMRSGHGGLILMPLWGYLLLIVTDSHLAHMVRILQSIGFGSLGRTAGSAFCMCWWFGERRLEREI